MTKHIFIRAFAAMLMLTASFATTPAFAEIKVCLIDPVHIFTAHG
jgi:hypothetical protein